jgi:hypothetical protein
MRLLDEDNGNCRVYCRHERKIYCWQDEGREGFRFYLCSQGGEPSHEVTPPPETPMTKAETQVGRDLNAFLEKAKG